MKPLYLFAHPQLGFGTSLGRDEQPPPLFTSRAPLQFCLPSVHNVVIVLLDSGKFKS
jgi:hypothetical protein